MDSVPTRVLRLGLVDRSLTWLVLAPISTVSLQRDPPISTSSSPGTYDRILWANGMFYSQYSVQDNISLSTFFNFFETFSSFLFKLLQFGQINQCEIKFKINYLRSWNQQAWSILTRACNRLDNFYYRMTDKEPGPVVFWNDTPLTHRYSQLANICPSELRRDYSSSTPWGGCVRHVGESKQCDKLPPKHVALYMSLTVTLSRIMTALISTAPGA